MKKLKIFSVLFILTITLFSFVTPIYATGTVQKHTAGEVISEGQSFIQKGEGQTKISNENLKEMSNTIYNILLVVGIILSIIVGIILGMKFITSGIEGKAEIKAMLVPYVVGNIVIFGAFGIWKIVVNILQSV